jgi:hypothetical protein
MKRFLLLCAVMLALPAAADSGWWAGYFPGPSSANPMGEEGLESVDYSHPDVELVRQDVEIVLQPLGAEVEGEFVFHNHGAAQTVPMYFPLSTANYWTYWDEETYRRNSGEHELILQEYSPYDFSAWLERGEEQETALPVAVYHEVIRDIRIPGEDYADGWICEADYARYDVSFAAGEELTLTVGYFQNYAMPKHGQWEEMYYPVDSGGTWRGPIGSGAIVVRTGEGMDFNGRWQYSELGLPPATETPAAYGSGGVRWEFLRLEPEQMDGVTIALSGMAEPWGAVTAAGGVNFRTNPDPTAERVAAHPLLADGEVFTFLHRDGDWLEILDRDFNHGWVRWRYVEGDTVNIYAILSPDGSTNNLPLTGHDW